MLAKLINHLLRENRSSPRLLIKNLITFYKYYRNLNSGIRSGKIYHQLTDQSPEFKMFVNEISEEDERLLKWLFKEKIKELFAKSKLHTLLDIENRIGTLQIGYNTAYIENPNVGLWTTGKATFYLPTQINHHNKIVIEIFSIPPVNVTVGFEEKKIINTNIGKLTSKRIEFTISPSDIINNISEIYISTDRLWLPHVIIDRNESIKIGIGIKSISVSYY